MSHERGINKSNFNINDLTLIVETLLPLLLANTVTHVLPHGRIKVFRMMKIDIINNKARYNRIDAKYRQMAFRSVANPYLESLVKRNWCKFRGLCLHNTSVVILPNVRTTTWHCWFSDQYSIRERSWVWSCHKKKTIGHDLLSSQYNSSPVVPR